MMEILQVFGGLVLIILMPILYIGGIFLMIVVARWIYMFIGVVSGDKTVIDEFDCRGKEPFWVRVLGFQARQDKRYPPPRPKVWQSHRPRDWRR